MSSWGLEQPTWRLRWVDNVLRAAEQQSWKEPPGSLEPLYLRTSLRKINPPVLAIWLFLNLKSQSSLMQVTGDSSQMGLETGLRGRESIFILSLIIFSSGQDCHWSSYYGCLKCPHQVFTFGFLIFKPRHSHGPQPVKSANIFWEGKKSSSSLSSS